MSEASSLRRYLPVVTFVSLLIVCTIPATSWIVHRQITQIFLRSPGGSGPPGSADQETQQEANQAAEQAQAIRAAAAQYPGDYGIQVAAAIHSPPDGPGPRSVRQVRALERLASIFPGRPALYAHMIRFATQDQILLHRREEYALRGSAPPVAPAERRPSAADFAEFDRNASAGGRLDPNNAYFPMMRAVGFFSTHRDVDAIVAIERAAQKPVWNDYTSDEEMATNRLYTACFGQQSAMDRTIADVMLPIPHFADFRAAARVAAWYAMRLEMTGHRDAGIGLRMALMRCGSLMRVQSSTLIGSLVGIAITRIAASRPDGAPVIPTRGTLTSAARDQRVDPRFLEYLIQSGDAPDASLATGEYTAGRRAKSIADAAVKSKEFIVWMLRLNIVWIVDIGLLANGLWLLIWSAVSALKWPRPGWPLGIHFILVVGGLALAFSARCWPLLISLIPASFIAVKSLFRRSERPAGAPGRLQTNGMTTACLLLLIYVAMVIVTAHYEAKASHSEDQDVRSGGQHMASLIGQQWPGPIPGL